MKTLWTWQVSFPTCQVIKKKHRYGCLINKDVLPVMRMWAKPSNLSSSNWVHCCSKLIKSRSTRSALRSFRVLTLPETLLHRSENLPFILRSTSCKKKKGKFGKRSFSSSQTRKREKLDKSRMWGKL